MSFQYGTLKQPLLFKLQSQVADHAPLPDQLLLVLFFHAAKLHHVHVPQLMHPSCLLLLTLPALPLLPQPISKHAGASQSNGSICAFRLLAVLITPWHVPIRC